MQESQDLKIWDKWNYDPLKDFNRSWWCLNNPLSKLYPLKRALHQPFLCLEGPDLVFSDPKRSTCELEGSTSSLKRHPVYIPLFMCILLGRESMAFFRFGTPKSLTCGMVPRDEMVHEGKSFGLFSAGTQLLEQSLVHSYCSMCMCVSNESISEWIKWQHWVLNLGCSDPRAVFPAPSPTEEATLVFQEG